MNIITLGDPMLRERSEPIKDFNEDLAVLVDGMFQTLSGARGLGLAAVQVGKLLRLFVVHVPKDSPRVFINPDILETSIEQVDYEEGCLSIPGINAEVSRPASVRVQAWNQKGRLFSLDADGLLARVIQHEYDHLNGVLFVDHLDPKLKNRLLESYKERVEM